MTRLRIAIAVFLLPLAACSQPEPAEEAAEVTAPHLDEAIAAYYQPYTIPFEQFDQTADWDRPIFSTEMRGLIGRWKTAFNDQEVTELQDFAWLCECQDWDSKTFEATVKPHAEQADGKASVDVDVAIGFNETRPARLELVEQDGKWLIDDIHSQSFPEGLKAALARVIEQNAEQAP